jgi:hypothetical protein
MVKLGETKLVDAVLDAYVDWWQEEATVRVTYRRFAQSSGSDRGGAHAAYAAAIDRKERACQQYATAIVSYRRYHAARSIDRRWGGPRRLVI